MKATTWYSTKRKQYEATVIGRGRPFQVDTADEVLATKRVIGIGTTKAEALEALAKAVGSELEVVPFGDQKVAYKGVREHTYQRNDTAVAA